MNDPFPSILGQKKLKSRLSFGLQSYISGGILPFYLFNGGKGAGKNLAAKALGKAIHKHDNGFKWCEINCAKFKKASDFFDSDEFQNNILRSKVVCFFDESHNLPRDLMNIFLTIFSTDNGAIVTSPYGGYELNLREQIFLFGTSEPDKMFAPLLDRLKDASIAPCSREEIQMIIRERFSDIQYEDGLLEEIAAHTRMTPRSAVDMAKDVDRYCKIKGTKTFSRNDWIALAEVTDTQIHGIDSVEMNILRILKSHGPCSLNELRAKTGISRTAISGKHEVNLLKNNLMRIDGKRQITAYGIKVIDAVKY